ncbi:hypothetical protein Nepgr_030666 [Nepenthes gracilis]|uniref:Uncharacterized protein n=1 Tax=Nepenthes gracilis TaxID=150966 RepID=A0AAD3TH00_NEPGR|nr:hypothetical protein Nepgr_030666 [Nepenthes gracilis]
MELSVKRSVKLLKLLDGNCQWRLGPPWLGGGRSANPIVDFSAMKPFSASPAAAMLWQSVSLARCFPSRVERDLAEMLLQGRRTRIKRRMINDVACQWRLGPPWLGGGRSANPIVDFSAMKPCSASLAAAMLWQSVSLARCFPSWVERDLAEMLLQGRRTRIKRHMINNLGVYTITFG